MKTVDKIIYPAIFENENNQFNVVIPDFNNAATWGKDLNEAIFMARDLLGALVLDFVDNNKSLPKMSPISTLKLNKNSFSTLIDLDLEKYKRSLIKSIKKTVYISSDLNEKAEELGLNFSQILRDALKKQIEG